MEWAPDTHGQVQKQWGHTKVGRLCCGKACTQVRLTRVLKPECQSPGLTVQCRHAFSIKLSAINTILAWAGITWWVACWTLYGTCGHILCFVTVCRDYNGGIMASCLGISAQHSSSRPHWALEFQKGATSKYIATSLVAFKCQWNSLIIILHLLERDCPKGYTLCSNLLQSSLAWLIYVPNSSAFL